MRYVHEVPLAKIDCDSLIRFYRAYHMIGVDEHLPAWLGIERYERHLCPPWLLGWCADESRLALDYKLPFSMRGGVWRGEPTSAIGR